MVGAGYAGFFLQASNAMNVEVRSTRAGTDRFTLIKYFNMTVSFFFFFFFSGIACISGAL